MKISIKGIPHSEQRYDTCGDYWVDEEGVLQVRISEMNTKSMWLVLLHEMTEIFLCMNNGVSFKDIDEFDIQFEKDRKKGKVSEDAEPGDDECAPYRDEHCMATAVERMVCGFIGLAWENYDKGIFALEYKPKKKK